MTAPTLFAAADHLPIEHATRYVVPATWLGHTDPIPAELCVSQDRTGTWSVGIIPDGWACLWLCDTPAAPWGPWRAHVPDCTPFPTARAAYDAALATDQVDPAT